MQSDNFDFQLHIVTSTQQVQFCHVINRCGYDVRHHVERPTKCDALLAQVIEILYGKLDAQQ